MKEARGISLPTKACGNNSVVRRGLVALDPCLQVRRDELGVVVAVDEQRDSAREEQRLQSRQDGLAR